MVNRGFGECLLERPGCTLRYRRRPSRDGRWVVFLHGAGMDGRMFQPQLPAVPDEFGVVVWDARGHGSSSPVGPFRYRDMLDDLAALIDTLRPTDLTLVGQSMGGNLAQSFTDAHPGTVTRMVLIDCTANHGLLTRGEVLALRSTRMLLTALPWRFVVAQSARACGKQPETARYAAACLRRVGKRRFVDVMDFWREALQPDETYRLPVPTLALVGADDHSGNISTSLQTLCQRDPRAHLHVIPNARHNSNMDQPEAVNTLLTPFLSAPPPPTP